jgi:flagellar biosynthesis/type III secretory pathway chaperone
VNDVTLSAALDALDALLDAEREAVRSVDATRALELADEKEALLGVLRAADWTNARPEIEHFRALVPRLRENGVLLAHARNSARDLVHALSTAARPVTYDAQGASATTLPGTRLSLDV